MGLSSSKVLALDNEIQTLKNQLEVLNLDKNNDGVITKNEFLAWQKDQKEKMELLEKKISEQYQDELADAKSKIDELKKENAALKTINHSLEKKMYSYQLYQTDDNLFNDKVNLYELSQHKIDEFVDKLLTNKKVNIGYFPDFVEKQIYRNVLILALGIMENTLNTTSINFMGHQLTFNLKPQQTDNQETDSNKVNKEIIDTDAAF